jgi:hypothetical protein
MILTTIVSFFGGNAFRLIWGEFSTWLNKRQDHKHELELAEAQAKYADAAHAREMESLKLQHTMGIEVVRVKGQQVMDQIDAEAFKQASDNTWRLTGIFLVDLWNGLIRPVGATVFLGMIVLHYYKAQWVLDETGWAMAGAFLGIYVADRSLMKRGK